MEQDINKLGTQWMKIDQELTGVKVQIETEGGRQPHRF